MMDEFARCYHMKTGEVFDIAKCHIRYSIHLLMYYFRFIYWFSQPRCLAHIINLAAQALISTRSKAKYYDANADEDAHIPSMEGEDRDEVGLVRAISVKVCTWTGCIANISDVSLPGMFLVAEKSPLHRNTSAQIYCTGSKGSVELNICDAPPCRDFKSCTYSLN